VSQTLTLMRLTTEQASRKSALFQEIQGKRWSDEFSRLRGMYDEIQGSVIECIVTGSRFDVGQVLKELPRNALVISPLEA